MPEVDYLPGFLGKAIYQREPVELTDHVFAESIQRGPEAGHAIPTQDSFYRKGIEKILYRVAGLKARHDLARSYYARLYYLLAIPSMICSTGAPLIEVLVPTTNRWAVVLATVIVAVLVNLEKLLGYKSLMDAHTKSSADFDRMFQEVKVAQAGNTSQMGIGSVDREKELLDMCTVKTNEVVQCALPTATWINLMIPIELTAADLEDAYNEYEKVQEKRRISRESAVGA